MTRHAVISIALAATANGFPHALQALLFYFVIDGNIPLDRLVDIAKRRFGIPNDVAWYTISSICPELIQ